MDDGQDELNDALARRAGSRTTTRGEQTDAAGSSCHSSPHPCLAPRWSSWAAKFRGFTLQLTAAQQEVARREALVNTMREGLALAQAAREKRRLVEQTRQVLREAERALAIAGGAELEAPPPGAPRLPEQYQLVG